MVMAQMADTRKRRYRDELLRLVEPLPLLTIPLSVARI